MNPVVKKKGELALVGMASPVPSPGGEMCQDRNVWGQTQQCPDTGSVALPRPASLLLPQGEKCPVPSAGFTCNSCVVQPACGNYQKNHPKKPGSVDSLLLCRSLTSVSHTGWHWQHLCRPVPVLPSLKAPRAFGFWMRRAA